MQKITLPIDTKSLFLNIFNDNESGHTATVSTPIKQGNSTNERLMQIFKIPKQINFNFKPKLIDELIKNSKSRIKINNVFLFDKISVNGYLIENDGTMFCMYIKEEVDPTKAQFGRIKLHYPLSLKFEDDDIVIDNKYIMSLISKKLNDYAFIVNSFEYDFDLDILNFNVTIIGENHIPYSKVFINNKGVGNKFTSIFNEFAESYDMEIVSLRQKYGQLIGPDNYLEYMEIAKDKAISLIELELKDEYKNEVINISSMYPYSLYDFECRYGYRLKYILVFYTTSNNEYFNISSKKLKFINDFKDDVEVLMITNVLSKEKIQRYSVDDILKFSKSINSLMLRKD
ncbi:MAG: hypothetical protein IJE53_03700 [Bacilli bacterium]|nr:hypothetical protein [Bacilli bacterium]